MYGCSCNVRPNAPPYIKYHSMKSATIDCHYEIREIWFICVEIDRSLSLLADDVEYIGIVVGNIHTDTLLVTDERMSPGDKTSSHAYACTGTGGRALQKTRRRARASVPKRCHAALCKR